MHEFDHSNYPPPLPPPSPPPHPHYTHIHSGEEDIERYLDYRLRGDSHDRHGHVTWTLDHTRFREREASLSDKVSYYHTTNNLHSLFHSERESEVFFGMFRSTNSFLARSPPLTVVNPDSIPTDMGTGVHESQTNELTIIRVMGGYVHTYLQVSQYMYVHTYLQVSQYVHTYMQVSQYMHTYIQVSQYMHTYIHTCTCRCHSMC